MSGSAVGTWACPSWSSPPREVGQILQQSRDESQQGQLEEAAELWAFPIPAEDVVWRAKKAAGTPPQMA